MAAIKDPKIVRVCPFSFLGVQGFYIQTSSKCKQKMNRKCKQSCIIELQRKRASLSSPLSSDALRVNAVWRRY